MKQIMVTVQAGSIAVEFDELDQLIEDLLRIRERVKESQPRTIAYIDYFTARKILSQRYSDDEGVLTRHAGRLWGSIMSLTEWSILMYDALCNRCNRHLFDDGSAKKPYRITCYHGSTRDVIVGTASLRSNLYEYLHERYKRVGPSMRSDMEFLVGRLS